MYLLDPHELCKERMALNLMGEKSKPSDHYGLQVRVEGPSGSRALREIVCKYR